MIRKKHIHMLLINAGILLFATFLVELLANLIIGTLFNGMFGLRAGTIVTHIFMRLCLLAVVAVSLYIHTQRDSDSHRAYLERTQGMEFDKRREKQALLHSPDYWIEVVIYAILFFVRFITDRIFLFGLIFILGSLLYIPLSLSKHLHIRRRLSQERLHK